MFYRFLDDRMFASCSDDCSVVLWDVRNLKTRVRTLLGHSNWVKNIEYSKKDNLIVTSGFDGSIFTWDINSTTETGLLYKNVFHTTGKPHTKKAISLDLEKKDHSIRNDFLMNGKAKMQIARVTGTREFREYFQG